MIVHSEETGQNVRNFTIWPNRRFLKKKFILGCGVVVLANGQNSQKMAENGIKLKLSILALDTVEKNLRCRQSGWCPNP